MRLNRSLLTWGVFFVVVGAVPLALQQGLVSEAQVEQAWRLWPLLLVAAGLGALLRRTPVEPLAGLTAAGLFGLIAGSVLATGSLPVGCGNDTATESIAGEGPLGPAAQVEIRMNCGDLTVGTNAGETWSLTGVADDGLDIASGPSSLEIGSGRSGGFGPIGDRERWSVTLPEATRLDLDLNINAGSGNIDLGAAAVERLTMVVNAGTATVDLAGVRELGGLDVNLNAVSNPRFILPPLTFTGSIEANAASNVGICPPPGAGLRLMVNDNITASNNYASRGLVEDGDAWVTPNFDGASIRIELETSVNAGNFVLEQEGTCG